MIGNGAYAHVRALPNPTNDARSIAKEPARHRLRGYEGTNLDRTAMQTTIRDFLREAARAQIAVVYYAGHGIQVDGRNYLVPVDIQFRAGSGMTDTMMDMDTIMAGLDDQVRTNVLILDACRNNPMAPKLLPPALPRHPSRIGAGRAGHARHRLDVRCGNADRVRDRAGTGGARRRRRQQPVLGGPLGHIGTPGLEVRQVLTRVRAEVVAATKSKQVPWSIRRCWVRFIWRRSDACSTRSFCEEHPVARRASDDRLRDDFPRARRAHAPAIRPPDALLLHPLRYEGPVRLMKDHFIDGRPLAAKFDNEALQLDDARPSSLLGREAVAGW